MGLLLFLTWALDGVNGKLHVPATLTRVGPTVNQGKYPPGNRTIITRTSSPNMVTTRTTADSLLLSQPYFVRYQRVQRTSHLYHHHHHHHHHHETLKSFHLHWSPLINVSTPVTLGSQQWETNYVHPYHMFHNTIKGSNQTNISKTQYILRCRLSMVQPVDLLVQTEAIYNELTLLISGQYETS